MACGALTYAAWLKEVDIDIERDVDIDTGIGRPAWFRTSGSDTYSMNLDDSQDCSGLLQNFVDD